MKDNKLNILFICNKSPWPPKEGGPIAMNNLIEGLIKHGHRVKVLAINTNKYAVDEKDIPENYKRSIALQLGYIDLSVKLLPAFFNLFSHRSYHVQRFVSKRFEKLLTDVLKQHLFDIVQIETLFMSPYIDVVKQNSEAKIILRAHNIEHLIWKRLYDTSNNPLKKIYLHHLSKTLEVYEKNILNRYDGIIPITEKDAVWFKRNTSSPVKAIPFGLDLHKTNQFTNKISEHALFHIGAMNWMPNEEGIRWFLHQVWPKLHSDLPKLKLYLAGREMPQWLKDYQQEGIVVLGEVADAYEFINAYTISIAPLLSGSGMRIKIIESMGMGKAVISTSIGSEGIDVENGKNILIADNRQDFVDAIKTVYRDKNLCSQIGIEAARLVREKYDNNKIISRLNAFYEKIL